MSFFSSADGRVPLLELELELKLELELELELELVFGVGRVLILMSLLLSLTHSCIHTPKPQCLISKSTQG